MVIKQTILYEDGPNDLFERFKLRDKSCDYYCCYCCVKGVFGTFQVFPSVRVHFAPLLTWDEVFRTSTDVV